MPTEQELIVLYRTYHEERLFECHNKRDDLTKEAQMALDQVITEYGGLTLLINNLEIKAKKESEKERILEESRKLYSQGKKKDEIISIVKSEILTKNEIIDILPEAKEVVEDQKIKPRTIIGGILGGLFGGTLGGALWGYIMIISDKIFFIFLFGLAFLCYFFVWLFTRQSKRNIAVIVITIISVVYAVVLGQAIYELFGTNIE